MSAARSARDDRHRSRVAALQLLYQREVGGATGAELDEAVRCYWVAHPSGAAQRVFATTLLEGVIEGLDRIDSLLETAADNWRLSRMAVVDRAILRLAVYELLAAATPPAVVIDEALELAKRYGGEQSAGFVNGVLDAVKCRLEERSDLPGLGAELEAPGSSPEVRDPKAEG